MEKKNNGIWIILALILAIVLGLLIPNIMKELEFLGTIYVNLLKFMIVPVIFTSIAVTIYKTKNVKGKKLLKTILVFMTMFIITFLITSLIVWLIKPGDGFEFTNIIWNGDVTELKLTDIIVNLIPANMITMFQNNALFGTIFFAVIFGIGATKVKKGDIVIDFIEGLRDVFYKILEYIMYLTPIGVFSLVGSMIANYKLDVINMGLRYIGMAYLCGLAAFILVMLIPGCIASKMSPIAYIKKLSRVFLMTFTTCSSVATLPTTIKTCKEEFKVSPETTEIVVPLGCTIHMCGGAVSFALLSIFCSQYFGLDITISKYILMIVSATLINMAAPGIPNGGIVIGASYLTLLGIPITFIGFYSGIYKILDMAYTTLNVTGDVTANIIIDKIKDKKC